MDFDNLMNAGIVHQSYWVRAIQAARKAGRRTAALTGKVSASVRRRKAGQRAQKPVIDFKGAYGYGKKIGRKPSRRRPHIPLVMI